MGHEATGPAQGWGVSHLSERKAVREGGAPLCAEGGAPGLGWFFLACECSRLELLDDAGGVVDAASPDAATGLYQGGPEAGVVGEIGVGGEVGTGRAGG